MRTSNAMQLKARIKARAQEVGVSPQLVMQDYLLERLLEHISLSKWRNQVVIKGGMLISSLIGIESRVTKDLDTTIRGFTLTHKSIAGAFCDICSIDIKDDLEFEFVRTEDIRENDDYPGIRVFLRANYAPMSVPLSVDITTGDVITPEVIEYEYPLSFDNYSIRLMAYPLATCMAEKLETVIARGVANTRPRDYYDIYMLWKTHRGELDTDILLKALEATAAKRKSTSDIDRYKDIVQLVAQDKTMCDRWETYAKAYGYVGDLSLQDVCNVVDEIMASIGR